MPPAIDYAPHVSFIETRNFLIASADVERSFRKGVPAKKRQTIVG